MITFDKLKLVADISAVRDYDQTRFEVIEKNGAVAAMKFYQETPFLLKLKLDFECREAVIEFSGKVLGKDYPNRRRERSVRSISFNIKHLRNFHKRKTGQILRPVLLA